MSRRSKNPLRRVAALAALLAAAVATPALAQQQSGTLQGIVVESATNRPLSGAQVLIPGTSVGTNTNAQGRFVLMNVPAGTHTLRVISIGYTESTRQVTITAGQVTTANFELEASAISLGEIVVTGVSGGAMERAKVPFTVSRVDASQMPVQAVNPLSQLQGRVPGANIAAVSGRPGVAPQVILRGPTSINAEGRGQEPLYVVDGVLLGSSIADINPADIESVEVVKGAAASTLYGSRAAAGVISITTKRGKNEGVRFTARTEYGLNSIEGDFGIARNMPYLLDETGTRFCVQDTYGSMNTCSRTMDYRAEQARINNAPGDFALGTASFPVDPGSTLVGPLQVRTFLAGNWPGTTYNAVKQVTDPKPIVINDFSMAGRMGGTSFHASLGHTHQGGAIMGLKGYERLNARVNVDQQIGDQWTVNLSTYVSRSNQDGANEEEGGGAFFRLTRTPAIADVTERDALGRLYIRTNLGSGGVQNENPLYALENLQREDIRWRYIGSGTVRYTPVGWLETNAHFALDRLNLNFMQFRNRGFRTTNSNPGTSEGLVFNGVNNSQSLNSGAGFTLTPRLFSGINNRFQVGWAYEQQSGDARQLQGTYLRVADVKDARISTQNQTIRSTTDMTRQMSLSAGTFFDVLDRYTFDFALRRDGNSRFGIDNRWQTYGRASAAWLMARESWFPSEAVTAFTLRGSYGSAGNAPRYNAQYESFSVASGGVLSASTYGNPALRPEVVTEKEVGLEVELLSRFGLSVTYANSLAKDQILPVPISVSKGFPTQWQNAGSMRNKTWEAALTLPVVQKSGFSWMSRLNYSRNRAVVEELNVAPFYIGTDYQGTGSMMLIEQGIRYGTFQGRKFITSCGELPADFRSQCGGATSAYQKNNEGYIVWVGEGNNPGMGLTDNLWNAVLPGKQAPWGEQVSWGMPMLIRDNDGFPALMDVGHALPDYRLGMAHTVQYRNFSLYGLVEGAFGQSVYNEGRHWSYLDFLSHDVDQGGKSLQDAKPIAYYYRAGPTKGGNPSGLGGFYDILGPNNRMVEDASFVKLRELSTSYRVGSVAGFGDWTVSVVGRNLKTWTKYSGFDPEVGLMNQGGAAGSGLINAIDAFTFPPLRTVSFVLSTNF